MAQAFAETERVDDGFNGSAAHTRRDLPAQEARGRSRKKHIHVFRIEDAADERFPASDQLDFVKKEGHHFLVPTGFPHFMAEVLETHGRS